jgi:hypothetical protein
MDDDEIISGVDQGDTPEDSESHLRETCDDGLGFDNPHEHEDK